MEYRHDELERKLRECDSVYSANIEEYKKTLDDVQKYRNERLKLANEVGMIEHEAIKGKDLEKQTQEITQEIKELRKHIVEITKSSATKKSQQGPQLGKLLDVANENLKKAKKENEELIDIKEKSINEKEILTKKKGDLERQVAHAREELEGLKKGFGDKPTGYLLGAKTVDEYREKLAKMEKASWGRVNFLPEKTTSKNKNITYLKNEIERIKLETKNNTSRSSKSRSCS